MTDPCPPAGRPCREGGRYRPANHLRLTRSSARRDPRDGHTRRGVRQRRTARSQSRRPAHRGTARPLETQARVLLQPQATIQRRTVAHPPDRHAERQPGTRRPPRRTRRRALTNELEPFQAPFAGAYFYAQKEAAVSYFLAASLVKLRNEVNALWPNRSKVSDGWIGDAAHSARKSDHNPDWSAPGRRRGVVRALDITVRGIDVDRLLRHTTNDSRVAYVIYNRRIYTHARGWYRYTGSNPHTNHVHVSIAHTNTA